jgi:hypothetical protein
LLQFGWNFAGPCDDRLARLPEPPLIADKGPRRTMRIPTPVRNALPVISAVAALAWLTAAGGLAPVGQFAPPAAAGEAADTADASPDGDTFTMMLDHRRVQPILGKEVRAGNGERMGRIVNVIVDGSGRPRAAIIDFGGFLGVGSRKIVVDWNALQFDSDSGPISLALTRDQVKAAPEYRDGKPVVVIGATSPSMAPE